MNSRPGPHHQEKTFIAVMGERDAVENCLSQLDGVKQLNFLSQEGSYLHFEITADSGRRIWNSVERSGPEKQLADRPVKGHAPFTGRNLHDPDRRRQQRRTGLNEKSHHHLQA